MSDMMQKEINIKYQGLKCDGDCSTEVINAITQILNEMVLDADEWHIVSKWMKAKSDVLISATAQDIE